MKTRHLSALLILAISPLTLLASSSPDSSSDTDRKIEDAAKASYNYRTVLEDHVSVKADNGVVTLTGTVQDAGQKELAVDTVENLPGVTGVTNDIVVKSDYPESSDGWIAFKIRGKLLVKADVSAANTTVSVKDGVVTLGGNADNLAQKELTGIYAREIEGVKSVENNITVPTPSDQTVGDKIDDASITAQVKYALLAHKGTSAVKTSVTTSDGAIVITGQASSDAEKSLVTELAQDVRGVKSVDNQMTVGNSNQAGN